MVNCGGHSNRVTCIRPSSELAAERTSFKTRNSAVYNTDIMCPNSRALPPVPEFAGFPISPHSTLQLQLYATSWTTTPIIPNEHGSQTMPSWINQSHYAPWLQHNQCHFFSKGRFVIVLTSTCKPISSRYRWTNAANRRAMVEGHCYLM